MRVLHETSMKNSYAPSKDKLAIQLPSCSETENVVKFEFSYRR